ncbi:MAG: zinc ribbon domain-containing protein [Bryobacterales bacterium]|nr:zinc ribbon domain-containing protein [Bryobacterales bacterium]
MLVSQQIQALKAERNMTCPSCSQALGERGAFCKWCGAQARCTSCKEVLEPQAKACVECGTLVGAPLPAGDGGGAKASANTPPTELPAKRNTITWREDRNSRDFQASLTDESMQTVGGFFGELFANRVGRPMQPGMNRLFNRDGATIEINQPQLAAPEPAEQAGTAPAQPPQAPPTPSETDDKIRIGKLFRVNGEALNLIDRRLKAKNGQDYTRRLTYLFLYAHELHRRYMIPRADVVAVLKEGKIWDSNASTWLKKNNGFKADGEDRLELLGEGRDDAKKFLIEAIDPNVQDEWSPDKKVTQKRAARKKRS